MANYIGSRNDTRSVAELVEIALLDAEKDDENPENWRAICALHARGTRDVLEAALAQCASPDAKRRILGARILGELGSPRSFSDECCAALVQLLRQDPEVDVIAAAVFALGHLGNRSCETDLLKLRSHPDPQIRYGVAFALGGATSPLAVQALLALMNDPHKLARDWATTSIGGTISLDGPEIREALLLRVEDVDDITRAEALHGLARRGDKRVVPHLIKALQAESRHEHLFCDAAQTYLQLSESDSGGKKALLRALLSL